MGNTGGVLYFAPDIPFTELVKTGWMEIVDQYRKRFEGYYLAPIDYLTQKGDYRLAFAAGALLVSLIDALSVLEIYPNQRNDRSGNRYKTFLQNELPSFEKEWIAETFYEHFRNGLLHEGRIKNGSMFSYDRKDSVSEILPDVLSINPASLKEEVLFCLEKILRQYDGDDNKRSMLVNTFALFCLRKCGSCAHIPSA